MFSKITPASLCVCTSAATSLSSTKLFADGYFGMIDTQMKREGAMIERRDLIEKDKRDANVVENNGNLANNEDGARVNGALEVHRIEEKNTKNRLTTNASAPKNKDINCNRTRSHSIATTPRASRSQQLTQMVSANGGGKRSPKSLDIRKEEVMAIRNRFPTKVPIIVQRFCKETALPQLDKSKYLVPQEITMSQFLTIIRNRMRINSTQTLYLLVNNRSMISLSLTLAEVYNEYAGVDGFLYVTYASQEVFGTSATTPASASRFHAATQKEANQLKFKTCQQSTSCQNIINKVQAMNDNIYKSMCFG